MGRGSGGRRGLALAARVLLLEALDAAGGVDELLLARVERVAVRANFDAECAAGRVGLDLVAARAGDDRRLVDRVDSLFGHWLGLAKRSFIGGSRPGRKQRLPRRTVTWSGRPSCAHRVQELLVAGA